MTIKRDGHQHAFRKIRPLVIERDKAQCIKCELALLIEVHHIDGYSKNSMEDLATLCYLCHCVAPMGKVEFGEWLEAGKSGVEELRAGLLKRGLRKLTNEQVLKFCSVFFEFNKFNHVRKLRIAREKTKELTGIGCGRKRYGFFKGEEKILKEIRLKRQEGKTGKEIAEYLQASGFPTRRGDGYQWNPSVVCKILARDIHS